MYTLGKVLHKGVGTTVQEATDFNDQTVVIKRISLADAESQEAIEHVRKEICLMLFYQHPNILKYHRSFTKDDEIWIVVEKYDYSLFRLIRPYGQAIGITDIPAYATIMHQALTGLKYLHDNGVIHRDVKSSNILVQKTGQVCVADFGVSKDDIVAKGPHSFVGTPCWMSPEVIEGNYDSKTDIWSFGITLLEVFKGKPPYYGYAPLKIMTYISSEPAPIPEKDELDNHQQLHHLISNCLHKDPDLRQTAEQLLEHKFWKNRKDLDYLAQFINTLLPDSD